MITGQTLAAPRPLRDPEHRELFLSGLRLAMVETGRQRPAAFTRQRTGFEIVGSFTDLAGLAAAARCRRTQT
jgi:hypothetical protein